MSGYRKFDRITELDAIGVQQKLDSRGVPGDQLLSVRWAFGPPIVTWSMPTWATSCTAVHLSTIVKHPLCRCRSFKRRGVEATQPTPSCSASPACPIAVHSLSRQLLCTVKTSCAHQATLMYGLMYGGPYIHVWRGKQWFAAPRTVPLPQPRTSTKQYLYKQHSQNTMAATAGL